MLTRTIDYYREEKEETIVSACELFRVSRQVYYRSKQSFSLSQLMAAKVVELALLIRQQMPRIGTRKLYYLLQNQLNDIGVGRDKLFAILKANHMLIRPKKNYRKTTDSYHRFYKHKNLIEGLTPQKPEQIWVSDITYIGSRGNHRYLALIINIHSMETLLLATNRGSCSVIRNFSKLLNLSLKRRQ